MRLVKEMIIEYQEVRTTTVLNTLHSVFYVWGKGIGRVNRDALKQPKKVNFIVFYVVEPQINALGKV